MLGEDILFLPVTELSARIKARKLSPVELTQSYLERSRTIGPRLNAYVTLTEKLALDQAHAAEKALAKLEVAEKHIFQPRSLRRCLRRR